MALLHKAICDFISLRKGNVLVGNVPGDSFSELPSQSLNAISEWGMIATYYQATGDTDVLKLAFEPAVRYLMLWEDFFHLGTRNHAWSGGPATVLLRYFVGVNEDLTVSSIDDIYPLTGLRCSFTDRNGDIKIIER